MLIQVGLENGNENRSVAWALDYPGCFAYGQEGPDAVINIARALLDHQAWLERHTPDSWLKDLADFDIRLVEVWQVFDFDEHYNIVQGGYSVDAWFRHDWKLLTEAEIQHGGLMLTWSRQDLLDTVANLTQEQLEKQHPGERWNIQGILKHIANADWWYMDRLGLAEIQREQMPADPFERLKLVRARLQQVLPGLAGWDKVVGVDGEFWSPRKLLRRALWHELDHIQHIQKLIASG